MAEYLIKVRGEPKGPYTDSQLLTQIRRKRLSRQSQVSIDGGMNWLRAGDVEALFPASAAVTDLGFEEAEPDPERSEPEQSTPKVKDSGERLWSYAAMGQQLGPVPESEIRMLIASGGLRDDTLLWQDGMTDWVEAQHIPAFSAAVRSKQSSSSSGQGQVANGMFSNATDQKTLHWPSVVAMLTAIAGWTTLLPSAVAAIGFSGGIRNNFSAESVVARLLLTVLVLSPSLLFCVMGINLGHKASKYSNNEPGQYDGTVYSVFALILGYLSALCILGLAIFCIVSASR